MAPKKTAPKSPAKPSGKSVAKSASQTRLEKELSAELKDLTKEVRKLKKLEFIQVFKHPWKFMGFSLLKGLMVGLGSVLGATVGVAIFVYLLSQISFVPIVGDFVEEIITEIQPAQEEQSGNPADLESPENDPDPLNDQLITNQDE